MGHDKSARMTAETDRTTLTRSGLLERSAWLAAGAGFPFATKIAAQDVSPVMTALSNYMSEARNRELPDKVLKETKHHILDTVAAMVSGSEFAPGRLAIQFARAYGGEKIATVVASSIVCGPIEAAFANGVLAHSDETDDSHGPSRSHPGVSVVPAAF